jgi:hypothetical protein
LTWTTIRTFAKIAIINLIITRLTKTKFKSILKINIMKTKKEIVYTMPYETETEIRKAQEKRHRLYEKYNNVQVYCNGLYEVRIIASNSLI